MLPPNVKAEMAETLVETRGQQIRQAIDRIEKFTSVPKSWKQASKGGNASMVRFFLDSPEARASFNQKNAAVIAAIMAENSGASDQFGDKVNSALTGMKQ
jgi:hypothetical protein